MEHKIILKCRTCLEDNDEDSMFELFMDNEMDSDRHHYNLKMAKKIEYCCGIRIRESNDMPSKICWKCFEVTRMWYNFRQMCLNSQLYLESLCEDRLRPEGQGDAEFLEVLMEELQIHRDKVYDAAETADMNSDNEDDDGDLDLLIDGEENADVFIETENDVERNIKVEPQPEQQQHQNSDKSDAREIATGELEDSYNIEVERNANGETNTVNDAKNSRLKKQQASIRRKLRPPTPTSFMCSICGNVYTKKATFAYHMSLHNDVKQHECEICGKSFRQLCELKNHMRRHTGEKPYKCSYCDRHFIDRSEKHRHERVHTNTRPYVCSVCGKSFMYSAILKNHSKLHTGKKDFNCMVCQKSFTLQHQLKAHLQTLTHKQKEEHYVSAGYEVIYE